MSRSVRRKQHDVTDCGTACLASVAAWYGLQLPVSRIRQYASTDEKGTTVLGMIEAAEKIGFSAKGVRGKPEQLSSAPLPAIAHVRRREFFHFIVIYRIDRKRMKVMDPADGKIHRIPMDKFIRQWTGVLILLAPRPSFRHGKRSRSVAQRLWGLMKPHRPVLLQSLAGAALYTLAGIATAIYVQLIVDHVLPGANRGLLNLLGAVMVILLLFRTIIQAFKSVFMLKTGQLIDARLILDYTRHMLHLPQRFFDTMRTGEILSRVGDAVKIRAFINDVAVHLGINLFVVIFSFALMFTWYWKLGLMMAGMLPVYLAIWLITNRFNRKTQRRLMENAAELESQLVETVHTAATIRQLGLEGDASLKIENRFIRLLGSVYRSGLNSLFSTGSTEFTAGAFTIALLWIGTGLVLDGAITAGELLSFYTLAGYFTGPVNELISMNHTIQDALIAGDRLFELMDLEPEERKGIPLPKKERWSSIRFENVTFRHGAGPPVLSGLSLEIARGGVTAITGESGSGKTTLINLLQKNYPVTSGRILIGELDLNHIETGSLRSRIGVVPQNIDLISGSVIENIAPGDPRPDMERILSISRLLGIGEMIGKWPAGFHTRLGENGLSLSGGEKQRVGIARALYRDPDILILDEATAALDARAENRVQRVIEAARREMKTVIVIAHRLSTIRQADRICLLSGGRVAECGTHHELLNRKGEYYQLWMRQFPSMNANRPNGNVSEGTPEMKKRSPKHPPL